MKNAQVCISLSGIVFALLACFKQLIFAFASFIECKWPLVLVVVEILFDGTYLENQFQGMHLTF